MGIGDKPGDMAGRAKEKLDEGMDAAREKVPGNHPKRSKEAGKPSPRNRKETSDQARRGNGARSSKPAADRGRDAAQGAAQEAPGSARRQSDR